MAAEHEVRFPDGSRMALAVCGGSDVSLVVGDLVEFANDHNRSWVVTCRRVEVSHGVVVLVEYQVTEFQTYDGLGKPCPQ